MKAAVMAAVVVTGLAAGTSGALAASPEYCAFYAREYAAQFEFSAAEIVQEKEVTDQAYYRCLNQDEAPALPEQSAYAGSDLDAATQPVIAEGDAEIEEIVAEPVAVKAVASVEKPVRRSRSGRTPWSPEWFAWCRKHFPNSFDEESGYVLPYQGTRRFC